MKQNSCIIRNSLGFVLLIAGHRLFGSWQVTYAEAIVIQMGMSIMHQVRLSFKKVESDELEVINILYDSDQVVAPILVFLLQ